MDILTKLDVTVESGTIKRGKYTFPKMDWLVIKVEEVLFKQSEKYCHNTIPAK